MTKKIMVFGAGKGIGRATADLAHEKGYEVFAVSRNKDDFKDVPYENFQLDLDQPWSSSSPRLVQSEADVIINCTGTHPGMHEVDQSWDAQVMDSIRKNVFPALQIYKTFLPIFRERYYGHFVHVSSAALDFPSEQESGYCASKKALESLVLCLSDEDKDKDTTVLHHAVRVSLTDTPLARKVCPNVEDWTQFYTAPETAKYLLDIVAHPDNYPKTIVTLPYRPVRD